MITKITPEQEAKIPEFIEKWINYASSDNNREESEKAIKKIYTLCKLKQPKFIHARSPKEATLMVAFLEKGGKIEDLSEENLKNFKCNTQTLKTIHSNMLYSQWLSSSCGWFDYTKFIGVQLNETQYNTLFNYCKNVFAIIPYEKVCIVCDKPIEVHFKNQQLHNETGPSILFSDGYSLYSLNGVEVHDWVVMTPAEEIDPVAILKEKNAEIRRELVRKIGIEKVCDKLNTKVIDTWHDYQLIDLDIPGMSTKPRYLRMKNPSVDGVYHIEGVPADKVNTCMEALEWRCGGIKWNPKQLT